MSKTRGSTRDRRSCTMRSAGRCLVAGVFPLLQAMQPRRVVWSVGFAMSFIALAVLLYADRDFASIFGRFGEVAGR